MITKKQKSIVLASLTYAVDNYYEIAEYGGNVDLVELALEAIEAADKAAWIVLADDPDNLPEEGKPCIDQNGLPCLFEYGEWVLQYEEDKDNYWSGTPTAWRYLPEFKK